MQNEENVYRVSPGFKITDRCGGMGVIVDVVSDKTTGCSSSIEDMVTYQHRSAELYDPSTTNPSTTPYRTKKFSLKTLFSLT